MKALSLARLLPLAGIMAFSLCSAWALFNLFNSKAMHPTLLYALPAVLVELVAAAAIYMLVERLKMLTLSNQAKQDMRFNRLIAGVLGILAFIPLGVSTWANAIEFRDNLLGFVFPTCTVICAVLSAVPHAIETHQRLRREEKEASKRNKENKRRRRETKNRERETREKMLGNLGSARETLRAIAENPDATQAQIAQAVGISRRTVVNHIGKLEEMGLIERNGKGVRVL